MDSVLELIMIEKFIYGILPQIPEYWPFKIDYAWKAKRIGKRVTELKDIFPKAMLN